MRSVLAALAVTLAITDASAGPMDVLVGRPPSVGVVQGGAFGADGTNYLGETRGDRPAGVERSATRRPAARVAHRVAHVDRAAMTGMASSGLQPVVAHPYRP